MAIPKVDQLLGQMDEGVMALYLLAILFIRVLILLLEK